MADEPQQCRVIGESSNLFSVACDDAEGMWAIGARQREIWVSSSSELRAMMNSEEIGAVWTTAATLPKNDEGIRFVSLVARRIQGECYMIAVTDSGLIQIFEAKRRILVAQMSVDRCVTAVAILPDESSFVVACYEGNESEVFLLALCSDTTTAPITVRGLYRVADCIECLVPVRHETLFSIARGGNVDAWDFCNSADVTEEFGNLRLDTSLHGAPVCGHEVADQLWIGMTDGAILVATLEATPGPAVSLVQHSQAVQSLIAMRGGKEIWSCGLDGKIVVWDASKLLPIGVFEGDRNPLLRLLATSCHCSTDLWIFDANGVGRLWEVTEQRKHVAEQKQIAAFASKGPTRDDSDAITALDQLNRLASSGKGQLVLPPSIEKKYPDIARLGEVVHIAGAVSHRVRSAFRQLKWKAGEDLEESVEKLCDHANSLNRQGRRAQNVAKRLSDLCPDFPLPSDLHDPFDMLLTASECVLEQVSDAGELRDPTFRPKTPPPEHKKRAMETSIDLSTPATTRGPQFVLEAQVRTLEGEVAELRLNARENGVEMRELKERLRRSQDEVAQTSSDLLAAQTAHQEAMNTAELQIAALKKSLVAAKQSIDVCTNEASVAESRNIARIAKLEDELREEQQRREHLECTHRRKALMSPSAEAHMQSSEKAIARLSSELEAKNALVKELLSYVRENADIIEELKRRYTEKKAEVALFDQRKAATEHQLAAAQASMRSLRNEAILDLAELHRMARASNSGEMAAKIEFVISRLETQSLRPPRGERYVSVSPPRARNSMKF